MNISKINKFGYFMYIWKICCDLKVSYWSVILEFGKIFLCCFLVIFYVLWDLVVYDKFFFMYFKVWFKKVNDGVLWFKRINFEIVWLYVFNIFKYVGNMLGNIL